MLKIKFPKKTNYSLFFKKEGMDFLNFFTKKKKLFDQRVNSDPHIPELRDLYNLYQLILLNNRTTILEYGCGWSTLVMHFALMKNNRIKSGQTFTRCGNPFELISVDNSRKFIKISKDRIKKFSKNYQKVKFNFSEVKMTKFNARFSTEYKKHPQVNPDFIYIDGPSQWGIKNKIDNFTVNHFSMMPMISDVLKFEHFLTPGTIIVTDGRTANARFLKCNFQRNWSHTHIKDNDQHYFILDEKSLGKWNTEQLNYYKIKN
jgi:hypothetical protein